MALQAGYQGALLVTSPPSVSMSNQPTTDAGDHQHFSNSNSAHRYMDKTQAVTVNAEWDELQTLSITGSPTGGTFTLTFGGQTTGTIAYNASAATVQSALQALSSIGSGNVTCTGGPLPSTAIVVEFTGTLGYANQATMTFANSLTGGSSPTPVVAVTQNGQAYTLQSASTYTVQYVGGVIIFTNPLQGTAKVQIASGYYFPYAVLANITQAQFDGEMGFQDITALQGAIGGGGGSGFRTYQSLLLTGTFSVTKFWVPETGEPYMTDITAATPLVLSVVGGSGNRFEGYVFDKKLSIKSSVEKITEESLDFQINGNFYIV